jgi:prepilin signal peptidase PulO-like enzyme (type II secretory pathway)
VLVVAIFAIALELRLAGLFLLGLVLGAFVNWATYRLAWNRRSISPWSAPAIKAPPRHWSDRLPVVGWLGLGRETPLHGGGFWIRPFLVELLLGGLLASLYFWETQEFGLCSVLPVPVPPNGADLATPNVALATHITFLAHAVLLPLMFAVSLIDIDEKTIPDSLTVPGTLFGLALAAIYPWSLLPDVVWALPPANGFLLEFMRLSAPAPNAWPTVLDTGLGLSLALACWWGWIFAMLRRRWILRRGWAQAWRWFCARLARESSTRPLAALGVVGSIAIAGVWFKADSAHWSGLYSSLVGAAAGGGIVWIVRLIGSATLGREAMGFGDVTLMAMVGAFVGWQAAILVFFLAPFAAIVLGVAQWLLRREHEIPFGPFLCLAAVYTIGDWARVWNTTNGIFALGWLLLAAISVCLVAMAGMLLAWRWFRARVLGMR